jgi:hypothetical protein
MSEDAGCQASAMKHDMPNHVNQALVSSPWTLFISMRKWSSSVKLKMEQQISIMTTQEEGLSAIETC